MARLTAGQSISNIWGGLGQAYKERASQQQRQIEMAKAEQIRLSNIQRSGEKEQRQDQLQTIRQMMRSQNPQVAAYGMQMMQKAQPGIAQGLGMPTESPQLQQMMQKPAKPFDYQKARGVVQKKVQTLVKALNPKISDMAQLSASVLGKEAKQPGVNQQLITSMRQDIRNDIKSFPQQYQSQILQDISQSMKSVFTAQPAQAQLSPAQASETKFSQPGGITPQELFQRFKAKGYPDSMITQFRREYNAMRQSGMSSDDAAKALYEKYNL